MSTGQRLERSAKPAARIRSTSSTSPAALNQLALAPVGQHTHAATRQHITMLQTTSARLEAQNRRRTIARNGVFSSIASAVVATASRGGRGSFILLSFLHLPGKPKRTTGIECTRI